MKEEERELGREEGLRIRGRGLGRPAWAVPVLLLALAAPALAQAPPTEPDPLATDPPQDPASVPTQLFSSPPSPPSPPPSSLTHELARSECTTASGRREVTLFANGTIRLREGRVGEDRMSLGELPPGEVEVAVGQLAEADLGETDEDSRGPSGADVERCVLRLELPGRPPQTFRYSRFDSRSLGVVRVLAVLEGLAERAGPAGSGDRLPLAYEPRPGDVLRHRDGMLFEVVGFTSDGRGVELLGIDQPLSLYLAREDLRREFVAVDSAAGERRR